MSFFKKNIPKPRKVNVVRTNGGYSRARGGFRKVISVDRDAVIDGARSFSGGKVDRLNQDWNLNLGTNLNMDIRTYKNRLDERTEDLVKNNPYIAGYLLYETANIIGDQGFRLQVQSKYPDGKLDVFANSLIEKKFKEWGAKEYCTMPGRLSFVGVQWLINNALIATGEFLIRKVDNVPFDDNPFSFSQELIDARDIDVTYSKVINDDRIVLMGVEIDKWRKIKRVYLKPSKLKDEPTYSFGYGEAYYQQEREYIDAKDLYFHTDSLTSFSPRQVRGYTPLASSLLLMKSIDRWESASLTNATLTARKMGFLIRKNMEGNRYKPKKEDGGGKYMDFEEGSIEELPYGYEYVGWDPKFPVETHAMFVKENIKKFATSRGVNYNSYANDYAGVTFSSLRSGAITERDIWKLKQKQISDNYCVSLYKDWLHWALMSQALAPLKFTNEQRYLDHIWMPNRWQWVKPLEDVQAKEKSVANLFESPIQVAADLGNDFEDIVRDVERVKKVADNMGINPEWLIKMMLDKKAEETKPDDETDDDETEQDEEDKKELRLLNQGF